MSRFAPAWDTVHAGLGFWVPVAPDPAVAVETMGSLRFLGNPFVLMPCSWTPAGPTCQAITARRRGPRCKDDKGSHEHVIFRGSIAGPRHSLSTLRSDHRWSPRKTRFRLLAKLCRVGLVTHKAPMKGFEVVVFYIFASLPKLSWRNDTLYNCYP